MKGESNRKEIYFLKDCRGASYILQIYEKVNAIERKFISFDYRTKSHIIKS